MLVDLSELKGRKEWGTHGMVRGGKEKQGRGTRPLKLIETYTAANNNRSSSCSISLEVLQRRRRGIPSRFVPEFEPFASSSALTQNGTPHHHGFLSKKPPGQRRHLVVAVAGCQ